MARLLALLAVLAAALAGTAVPGVTREPAPCAPPAAADPMPEGGSHDHADPAHHRFQCGLRAVASLDLRDTVPDAQMFGELDIAGEILVMATTFPDAGFVLFDISDPLSPAVLSRFRGPACETKTDVDCGADVKITPDARYVFIGIQRTGGGGEAGRLQPGIMTVDVSDPRAPREIAFERIPPVGVHMLAFHKIGDHGWVFARARGLGRANAQPGVAIFRVEPGGKLLKTGEIVADGAHDVSLYDDPKDKTTYLYLSGAQAGVLQVYDVGDPIRPHKAGEWQPAVEVPGNAWYVHNAWTFRDGSRRYTLAGPELYTEFAPLPPGHGSVAGPMWLLDTTDHANIRMIGEWRNPGGHAAGDLTFSPHNSWYAGDGVSWTAHYHGGVWVLDWREVMAGDARRPREIGYHVPHAVRRDFVTSDAERKVFTGENMQVRPLIWDVVATGRHGYASDINGGLVVLERPEGPAAGAQPPGDGSVPQGSGGGNAAAIGIVVLLVVGAPALAYAMRRR
ncbi:MAG TPA: hypothetical protein VM841_05940 [Actinomycetota bacterium]|nr:hypothetical protein [Actinomycetota bacterium]